MVHIECRRRGRTLTAYRKTTCLFLASCKKKDLASVNSQDVDLFVADMKKRGNSARTRANRVTALRSFLRWAGRPDVVTKNEIPNYTEKVVAAYTLAQVCSLLKAASSQQRLTWEFFLGSGCREQEVMFACWPDLDFDIGVLHVREKADLGFKIKDGEKREVPLSDDLMGKLKDR